MIATSFALVAFATAVLVGMYVGNDLYTVLGRAVAIMLGCYVVGLGLGVVAQWVVDNHVREYQQNHPIPTDADDEAASSPPRAAA